MKTVLIWLALCFGTLMTTCANGTAYLFSYFINDSRLYFTVQSNAHLRCLAHIRGQVRLATIQSSPVQAIVTISQMQPVSAVLLQVFLFITAARNSIK